MPWAVGISKPASSGASGSWRKTAWKSNRGQKNRQEIFANCNRSRRRLSMPNHSRVFHEIKSRCCDPGSGKDPAASLRLQHGAVLLRLMGHVSIETTAGYKHPVVEAASNPLDDLAT